MRSKEEVNLIGERDWLVRNLIMFGVEGREECGVVKVEFLLVRMVEMVIECELVGIGL